ncbi:MULTISPECIES: hypothetical protein [unclassified Enterococcus]|uniref:hypothetical protein n=1 Tax=unclassified Enterococcus TaxID=2608891 RepID=UPI0024766B63|nr:MULTISPECIES: hypothetical protein [unclassified Enterococcus]
MHFIVESELRRQYQKAAFSSFTLSQDMRLTPEAKQFLIDRKIKLITNEEQTEEKSTDQFTDLKICRGDIACSAKVLARLENLSATAFLLLNLLLEKASPLTEDMMLINYFFQELITSYQKQQALPPFPLSTWQASELQPVENRPLTILDLQGGCGRELTAINYLQAALNETLLLLNAEVVTAEDPNLSAMIEILTTTKNSLAYKSQEILTGGNKC